MFLAAMRRAAFDAFAGAGVNAAAVVSACVAAFYTFATSRDVAGSLGAGFVVLGGVWLIFFVWYLYRNLRGWNRLWEPISESRNDDVIVGIGIKGRERIGSQLQRFEGIGCRLTTPDGTETWRPVGYGPRREVAFSYRAEFPVPVAGRCVVRWYEKTKGGKWRPILVDKPFIELHEGSGALS